MSSLSLSLVPKFVDPCYKWNGYPPTIIAFGHLNQTHTVVMDSDYDGYLVPRDLINTTNIDLMLGQPFNGGNIEDLPKSTGRGAFVETIYEMHGKIYMHFIFVMRPDSSSNTGKPHFAAVMPGNYQKRVNVSVDKMPDSPVFISSEEKGKMHVLTKDGLFGASVKHRSKGKDRFFA